MKFLLVLIGVLSITNINAQRYRDSIEKQLIEVILFKHSIEAAQEKNSHITKVQLESKTKLYINAIKKIKKEKSKILPYLDYAIKNDSLNLSNRFLDYKFVHPLSSTLDSKNIISFHSYFKVIKYCFFTRNDNVFPPLEEISHILKDKFH